MSKDRKYLPTLSELIDRLSIVQLKEVFIPDHKEEYSQEIKDIVHDIDLLLSNSKKIDGEVVRAIVVLSQMNLHIWHNESNYRKGNKEGNNLELTHLLALTILIIQCLAGPITDNLHQLLGHLSFTKKPPQ